MNKEHFVEQYTNLPDEELLEIYDNQQNYSADAVLALNDIVAKRGGIDVLIDKEKYKLQIIEEKARVNAEVKAIRTTDAANDEFLYKMITSDILSEEELKTTIANSIKNLNVETADITIKPRTIYIGIIAAIFSAVIGGILWGLHMMWSGRVFLFLGLGLVLLCYHIIKAATKQSYKNALVLVLTICAVIIALFIGEYMWDTYGLQK